MSANNLQGAQSHFPATGSSYRIATDGDHLIIKNVLIKGLLYDVKICRRDANGEIVSFTTDEAHYQGKIRQIAETAAEMFKQFHEKNITTTKISFSNTGTDLAKKYSCRIEDLTKREGADGRIKEWHAKDLDSIDAHSEAPFIKRAALIHELISNATVLIAADPSANSEVIYPSFEPHVKFKAPIPGLDSESDDEEDDDISSVSSGGESDCDEDDFGTPLLTPRTPLDEPETPAPAIIPSPPPVVDAPTEPAPWVCPPFLNGITFDGLARYSSKPTQRGERDQHKVAYDHFKNLLKNPDSENPEERAVLRWLQEEYIRRCRARTERARQQNPGTTASLQEFKQLAVDEMFKFLNCRPNNPNELIKKLKATPID